MFMVTVDGDLCVGCEECAKGCPAGILVMENGKASPNDDECLGCQSCTLVCPVGAITVEEF